MKIKTNCKSIINVLLSSARGVLKYSCIFDMSCVSLPLILLYCIFAYLSRKIMRFSLYEGGEIWYKIFFPYYLALVVVSQLLFQTLGAFSLFSTFQFSSVHMPRFVKFNRFANFVRRRTQLYHPFASSIQQWYVPSQITPDSPLV